MHRTTVGAVAVLAAVGLGVALPATAQAAPHHRTCPSGWVPGFAMTSQGLFQACVVADETADPGLTAAQLDPARMLRQSRQHQNAAKPAKPARHLTPAQRRQQQARREQAARQQQARRQEQMKREQTEQRQMKQRQMRQDMAMNQHRVAPARHMG